MISLLRKWQGAVVIDGVEYENIASAESAIKRLSDGMNIILKAKCKNPVNEQVTPSENPVKTVERTGEIEITVKPYMTKPATPEFDFMAKWNDDKPMPLRTMTGVIEKETRGMVYMHLHGQAQETVTCMCCGRELTHPVSRHYGIGPICMNKVGIMCDIEDIETIKEKLVDVKWSGWVIRSAIIERREV